MSKRKNTRLYIIIGAVVALLLVLAIVKGRSRPRGQAVTVESVERRTIKETVSASGKIFPEIEVNISSDVSGEVVELYVQEGDSVSIGQLLAKIDPDIYQSAVERVAASVETTKAQLANSRAAAAGAEAQVLQAKAQLAQIEAQLANQKTIHQRNEKLLKDKVIAQQDFDNSLAQLRSLEANRESAQASVEAAQASLRSAQESIKAAEFNVKGSEASLRETRTNLRRTELYAPMSGIVSSLSVEKGERVVGTAQMTGTEIMRIADLSSIEVQVDVSESDVLRVSLGDPVEIEVDAYLDRVFTGKVTQIANSASNATGQTVSLNSEQVTNFVVKIRVDRESYADLVQKGKRFPFRPGMSATVEINTNTAEKVLSVPIMAVTVREDKESKDAEKGKEAKEEEVVFSMGADGKAEMHKVSIGLQDDRYIEIKSGLEEGQDIIAGPYATVNKLKKGEAVYKKEEERKKEDKDNKEDEDAKEE